jgi:hypothetical protein
MGFTLFDLILHACESLGKINESVVTGGTTSTLVDSTQTAARSRFTDDVMDGIIFLTHDVLGTSVAPEGEFGRITSFTESTGTYGGTWTVAPAAGDTYAWTSQEYPLQRMIGLANEGLQRIGNIPLVDKTTLDTDGDNTEYACSAAWKYKPTRVDIQGNTGNTSDNQWQKVNSWEYEPSAAGSSGLIILPYQPSGSKGIRVWYMAKHPYVSSAASVINEHIEPELATLSLVAKALGWNCKRSNGANKFLIQAWNQAEQEFQSRLSINPRPSYHYPRKSNLMIIEDDD